MKVFLRHIAFPNVLKSYHQLLEELGIADNSNLTATINNSSYQNDSSMIIDNDGGNSKGSFGKVKIEATMKLPIQIAPVSTHKANDEQQLKSFFDNITAGKGGKALNYLTT